MFRKVHHVGIVVRSLEAALDFYRDCLGLPVVRMAEVPDQRVRAALLASGESELELLEPTDPSTGVARFLAKRGEGLHHLCLETDDVAGELTRFGARGVPLIDRVPRPGLAGRIGFLHPGACAGVLVELATPTEARPPAAAPLRLCRVVVGTEDPVGLGERFQSLFGLPLQEINAGKRVQAEAGPVALLLVPADQAGGTLGMLALALQTDDLSAAIARLEAGRRGFLRGAREITVEPASSHGVPLHISQP